MECVYSIWSETGTSCKIYFNSLQFPDKNYERGFQYLFLQQKLTLFDWCVMRMLEGVNDTWCEMQEQCPQTMLQTWFADKIVMVTARHWMSQLVPLLLKSRELCLAGDAVLLSLRRVLRSECCVSPKFICWNPNPNVMLLGGGAFRWLGHEGRTLMNGFSALMKVDRETSLSPSPCEVIAERPHLWIRKFGH